MLAAARIRSDSVAEYASSYATRRDYVAIIDVNQSLFTFIHIDDCNAALQRAMGQLLKN